MKSFLVWLGNGDVWDAAELGRLDLVQRVVDGGVFQIDTMKNDRTLLHIAALHGQTHICEYICTKGVNVNAATIYTGDTPLIYAVMKGYINIVRILCQRGALLNHINKSEATALTMAIKCNMTAIVAVLIEYGADVNFRQVSNGWTPLIAATCAGNLDIVKLLCTNGADISSRARNGYTAIDFANHSRLADIWVYLNDMWKQKAAITYATATPVQATLRPSVSADGTVRFVPQTTSASTTSIITKNIDRVQSYEQSPRLSNSSTTTRRNSASFPNLTTQTSSILQVIDDMPAPTYTDIFLSHDWGKDELGRDNHARVSCINKILTNAGLTTWFDEERINNGSVRRHMIDGITHTKCVLVFVTDKYRTKVNSDDRRDNCCFEFNHAFDKFSQKKIIPIVMETRMRNNREWDGILQTTISDNLYIDLSSDTDTDIFTMKCQELINRIYSTISPPVVREEISQNMLGGSSPIIIPYDSRLAENHGSESMSISCIAAGDDDNEMQTPLIIQDTVEEIREKYEQQQEQGEEVSHEDDNSSVSSAFRSVNSQSPINEISVIDTEDKTGDANTTTTVEVVAIASDTVSPSDALLVVPHASSIDDLIVESNHSNEISSRLGLLTINMAQKQEGQEQPQGEALRAEPSPAKPTKPEKPKRLSGALAVLGIDGTDV